MYKTKTNLLKIINGFRTTIFTVIFSIFKQKIKCVGINQNYNIYIEVNLKYLYPVLFFLKNHSVCKYNVLIDLVCYEIINSKYRYILIYNLLNINTKTRIFIKTKIKELNLELISINTLFHTANWSEREVYDFFGLFFYLNKDLRRILLDYGFKGYPLKKDFPLSGFLELFYDDTLKKITYEKIILCQEYRIFFYNKNHR